jgi:leucyl aminopeptidase
MKLDLYSFLFSFYFYFSSAASRACPPHVSYQCIVKIRQKFQVNLKLSVEYTHIVCRVDPQAIEHPMIKLYNNPITGCANKGEKNYEPIRFIAGEKIMKIKTSAKASKGLLIEGVFEGEKRKDLPHYFDAKLGDFEFVHHNSVIFVGLGKKEKFNLDVVRTAMACAVQKAKGIKAIDIQAEVFGKELDDLDVADVAQAMVEGAILSNYEYHGHKRVKKISTIKEFTLVDKNKEVVEGAKIGEIMGNASNNARDLVNGPANEITPTFLANYAKKMAKEYGLKVKVLEPKAAGMELINAIAKGSTEPSKLLVLEWRNASKQSPLIGVIGKGITFDSGGISIKPSNKMWEMKTDMAGAAATILAMRAVAELNLKKNILAVVPLTENMPGCGALKPGDVVSSLDGITVEIISTDAEGRMILADAITYAKHQGVKKIFDSATLTGGCVIALGDVASGLLGNNEDLIEEVKRASEKSGEKMWQLPLYEEYNDYLKSEVADIKNCMDKGMASASTGATFLHKFVGDTPWVHVDIAGTAFNDSKKGCLNKGASGVPLRTIIEWLKITE